MQLRHGAGLAQQGLGLHARTTMKTKRAQGLRAGLWSQLCDTSHCSSHFSLCRTGKGGSVPSDEVDSKVRYGDTLQTTEHFSDVRQCCQFMEEWTGLQRIHSNLAERSLSPHAPENQRKNLKESSPHLLFKVAHYLTTWYGLLTPYLF